jgi:DNA polymerase-3 subunit chi
MTRIDFYKLASSDLRLRRQLVCRITEKAWRTGITLYIRAGDHEEARLLDDMLWTFRQGSFIPHALLPESGEIPEHVSVLIGAQNLPPQGYAGLLIDLKLDQAAPHDAFERIAVVLNEDPLILQQGRQRYKAYREAGCQIETHFFDAAGNATTAPPAEEKA